MNNSLLFFIFCFLFNPVSISSHTSSSADFAIEYYSDNLCKTLRYPYRISSFVHSSSSGSEETFDGCLSIMDSLPGLAHSAYIKVDQNSATCNRQWCETLTLYTGYSCDVKTAYIEYSLANGGNIDNQQSASCLPITNSYGNNVEAKSLKIWKTSYFNGDLSVYSRLPSVVNPNIHFITCDLSIMSLMAYAIILPIAAFLICCVIVVCCVIRQRRVRAMHLKLAQEMATVNSEEYREFRELPPVTETTVIMSEPFPPLSNLPPPNYYVPLIPHAPDLPPVAQAYTIGED